MKPLIAIPMGDAAGIGPEITAKALMTETVQRAALCIVIGDRKIMEKAMEIVASPMKLHVIKDVAREFTIK